jgi:hypothetical protein
MTEDFLSTQPRWPQGLGIHTKSHDDRFRLSNNNEGTTSIISEAIVFVLLMGGVCMYAIEMGSDGMTCLPSFMTIGSGI